MNRILITLSIFLFSLLSCEKTGEKNRSADRDALDKLKFQIEEMVKDVPCNDSSQWAVAALGHKACGGAVAYIAYPSSIDVDEFLEMVQRYTQGEKEYNEKYNIISDCMWVIEPEGVRCENGKPVFVYKDFNTATKD